jgi:hypothetical protein
MSRARTQRRIEAREAAKDASRRLKLAKLEMGGTAERAIVVPSAAVIEPRAASQACVVCGASVRVKEHTAIHREDVRVVRVYCPACGLRREVFFRIARPH